MVPFAAGMRSPSRAFSAICRVVLRTPLAVCPALLGDAPEVGELGRDRKRLRVDCIENQRNKGWWRAK